MPCSLSRSGTGRFGVARFIRSWTATASRSPGQHVRAGRWVRVRGLTENDGRTPILLQIQQAVNDLTNDTLELTVARGMTQRSLQERTVETVAAVRTGRNPVSAAKAV